MANHVEIVEVAPRDGLQADPADLSTDQKVALIKRLISAGHTRIEAASFVSPTAVPKMADADALMAAVPRSSGVTYSALVLNRIGVERAIASGVDEITGVVVASETFSQQNQNSTIEESIDRWRSISDAASKAGLRRTVTIASAFGCPFEGRVDQSVVRDIALRLAETGPAEITLADTIGVAVPNQVADLFGILGDCVGDDSVPRGHFHNTRNTAMANIVAAVGVGVRVFDASLGGVGGCPFAPKATGNVATEDVVYMLHAMEIQTGLDLNALIAATEWLESLLGHTTPGMVAKAGGFPSPPTY
ncbi:MAG: hydroxymethylglutaryl-CoA lyase [Acidobacteria bacterium]|nr:hydroxymethylglutaryl-CoA lyase [Acidobacteriota bacterium]